MKFANEMLFSKFFQVDFFKQIFACNETTVPKCYKTGCHQSESSSKNMKQYKYNSQKIYFEHHYVLYRNMNQKTCHETLRYHHDDVCQL